MTRANSGGAGVSPVITILQTTAAAAVTVWGFYHMVKLANQRWAFANAAKELHEAQEQLAHEKGKSKMERSGRIRAEQELRRLRLAVATGASYAPQPQPIGAALSGQPAEAEADGGDAVEADGGELSTRNFGKSKSAAHSFSAQGTASSGGTGGPPVAETQSFPLQPIGYLQSCFSTRNGTPRQPLLVTSARARLQLLPDVPIAALDGLEQYSHVWVIYIFHQNTNLPKALQPGVRSGIKAAVNVPRLNGGRMGVLATRSPHRPVPIGLSVARVLSVGGGVVMLGGGDLVDGSPVLDIKPYVPFCDSVPAALAPKWVQAEADDEPLSISAVRVPPSAEAQLAAAWCSEQSLYPDAASFIELVTQVLSRDIRSLHQRLGEPSSNERSAGGNEAGVTTSSTSSALAPAVASPLAPRSFASTSVAEASAASRDRGVDDAADRAKLYHVVLEGIDVSYVFDSAGGVVLVGAQPNQHPDNKRERTRRAAVVRGPVRNCDLGTPYR